MQWNISNSALTNSEKHVINGCFVVFTPFSWVGLIILKRLGYWSNKVSESWLANFFLIDYSHLVYQNKAKNKPYSSFAIKQI